MAVLAAVALAASSYAQAALVHAAVLAQQGVDVDSRGGHPLSAAWVRALPYPVVDRAYAPPQSLHAALLALGILQTALLFVLWRAQRERVLSVAERVAGAVAALVMAAVALFANALTSFDVYAYVGYARLGLAAAYAPVAHAFSGSFAPIADVWGDPMTPNFYGPLWVWLSGVVAGHAPTLGASILAFRWLEVAALAVVIAALAVRRTGVPILLLVALNPALYAMYVVNAHNDLLAAALVLVALACAPRLPALAAVFVACAGLVKLPLIALSFVVFAGDGALRRRIGYVALAVALTFGASWVFGGRIYFDDLLFRLHTGLADPGFNALVAKAVRTGLLVAAAVALVAALVRGMVWRSAAWTMIALSSLVYPWYLAWSVAYAASARRVLVPVLIALPVAAAFLDSAFPALGLGSLGIAVMLAYAIVEAVRARRTALPVDTNAALAE